ncbi:MAG TPA: DUF1425 domain-containing protein [Verrucomicrobiae bacterium]|nr:DUF1425 domain-containing protein [Verrucomicrobiae bacterium]
MKKILLLLVSAASGLVLSTGCQTHDTGAFRPQNTTVNNLEDVSQFVLFDKGAQHSVTCDGLQQQRLPDGRLQIAANVRNRENRRIQVQVNCEFKDGQGFVVENTPFQNLFLDENAQEGVQFVSLNDKAQRYTIRVRQAR